MCTHTYCRKLLLLHSSFSVHLCPSYQRPSLMIITGQTVIPWRTAAATDQHDHWLTPQRANYSSSSSISIPFSCPFSSTATVRNQCPPNHIVLTVNSVYTVSFVQPSSLHFCPPPSMGALICLSKHESTFFFLLLSFLSSFQVI